MLICITFLSSGLPKKKARFWNRAYSCHLSFIDKTRYDFAKEKKAYAATAIFGKTGDLVFQTFLGFQGG
jgi:hypothetical protein